MTDHNLVLISGAGGVGRLVTERLLAQSVPVRVLVRRENDGAVEVRALGAEVVTGDLTRPETVAPALDGVRRAYFGRRPIWTSPCNGGAQRYSRKRACHSTPSSTSRPWRSCTARTATTG